MEDSPRLGPQARTHILQPGNTLWISTVSVWEMAIKFRLGRLELKRPLDSSISGLLDQGVRSLSVAVDHALAIQDLPLHHGDPFDRMLIAQARVEDLTLITADLAFRLYDVRVLDAAH